MSRGILRKLADMGSMGYPKETIVGHGFRSMFSTIANEAGLWSADAIERQLAHVPKDAVRAAYNHAGLMDARREMMQWWADWLEEQEGRTGILIRAMGVVGPQVGFPKSCREGNSMRMGESVGEDRQDALLTEIRRLFHVGLLETLVRTHGDGTPNFADKDSRVSSEIARGRG